jgi:hypothetical protein
MAASRQYESRLATNWFSMLHCKKNRWNREQQRGVHIALVWLVTRLRHKPEWSMSLGLSV